MYVTTENLVEALRATPHTLTALLRAVTPERARVVRGNAGDWSVLEVVCHLRDVEERALVRMRALRDQEYPRIRGYDPEALAKERRYAAEDLARAVAAFQGFRATHTAELAALRPDEWDRSGIHEEFGELSIHNHTLSLVWHDAIHAAQIGRQLLD
jgi:hypothetical protein